jgi:hypothetical protein
MAVPELPMGPDCKEDPPYIRDKIPSGDTVCKFCGLVLESHLVDTRPERQAAFSNDYQDSDYPYIPHEFYIPSSDPFVRPKTSSGRNQNTNYSNPKRRIFRNTTSGSDYFSQRPDSNPREFSYSYSRPSGNSNGSDSTSQDRPNTSSQELRNRSDTDTRARDGESTSALLPVNVLGQFTTNFLISPQKTPRINQTSVSWDPESSPPLMSRKPTLFQSNSGGCMNASQRYVMQDTPIKSG